MIEDQTTLITILNEVINSNKIKINSSSSIKEKYFKELNLLKDNINNISIILHVTKWSSTQVVQEARLLIC